MTMQYFETTESTLPDEYWPCPLCIMTLMEAHATGTIHHQHAFNALRKSGLVHDLPGDPEHVTTTDKGRAFVDMILATPLPKQRWVDPRRQEKP